MKRKLIAMAATSLGLCLMAGQPAAAQKLSARHKTWLETEVNYIISKEERDLFLRLATDADRDKYIELFWARRDKTSCCFFV